ncbi:rCG32381 [Rattus norvegicus]|uniref:RCG32381 n=1 Tax=Rattus norvegicus TaxID=10116 RepID=A6JXM1_RAT|nr:rCG32381 [Rattus norvegicus]
MSNTFWALRSQKGSMHRVMPVVSFRWPPARNSGKFAGVRIWVPGV